MGKSGDGIGNLEPAKPEREGRRPGYPASYAGNAAPDLHPTDEMDIRRLFRLLVEHRWLFAGTVALTLVIGLLYAFLAPRQYRGVATVFVDRSSAATVKEVDTASVSIKEEVYYTSQFDILKSRQVAEMAFQAAGLANHPAFQGASDPVAKFQECLRPVRRIDSAIFEVIVQSPYQEDVAVWANAYAEAYVRFNLQMNTEFVAEANRLVVEQTRELQERYSQMQSKYGEVLRHEGGYFPQEQKQIYQDRIKMLEAQKSDILVRKQESLALVGQLGSLRDPGRDPLSIAAVRLDPAVQGLMAQQEMIQKEMSQMQAQFTSQYPPYVKKAEELSNLKARIRSQALLLLDAEQGKLSALSSQEANLNAEISQLMGQSIQGASGSSRVEGLASGVEATQKYLALMSDKMQQMDVAGKLLASKVRILDRATPPKLAYSPRRGRTAALSLLLGLVLGTGLVVGIGYFDTRIKDVDAVESTTGLSCIGLIPTYEEANHTLVVEAFQTLRTSLYYASDQKKRNVILVTSCSSGEGKSSCVTNLGMILASSGERVLVVDGDLRKPSLHKFLKVTAEKGLADFLADSGAGLEGYLYPTKTPKLFVVPCGTPPSNPPALFSMRKFAEFIQWARKEYDWVLLDSPPCLAVTDSQIMAEHSDLVLMVAYFNSTSLPMFRRTVETLDRQGHEIAGVVLNHYEWQNAYYYKHYYYYGGTKQPDTLAQKLRAWLPGQPPRHKQRPRPGI